MTRRFWIIALTLSVCVFSATAQTFPSEFKTSIRPVGPSWFAEILTLSFLRFFAPPPPVVEFIPVIPVLPAQLPPPEMPPPPPCRVAPIPPIDDLGAQQFEASSGTSAVVDVNGLTPAMSAALDRFVRSVADAGGSLELKSAYRPPAYQAHLQAVWDKWKQLRNNQDPRCDSVRAAVREEFDRHRLIESQRPVTYSDHTRGNAFDATVFLPPQARLANRRVTLDKLAQQSGIRRPDIVRDPVHFRLIRAPSPRS